MSGFVKQSKEEMHGFVVKAIEDLLDILDSEIVYPEDNNGVVQEHKLIAVVQAREQVYLSAMNLIDLIDIESQTFVARIVSGLKTTWHELTKITTRNLGGYALTTDAYLDANGISQVITPEMKKEMARKSIEDNYLASIAKAKELSAKVAYQILERIDNIEMSEEDRGRRLAETYSASTAEKYARRYAGNR